MYHRLDQLWYWWGFTFRKRKWKIWSVSFIRTELNKHEPYKCFERKKCPVKFSIFFIHIENHWKEYFVGSRLVDLHNTCSDFELVLYFNSCFHQLNFRKIFIHIHIWSPGPYFLLALFCSLFFSNQPVARMNSLFCQELLIARTRKIRARCCPTTEKLTV